MEQFGWTRSGSGHATSDRRELCTASLLHRRSWLILWPSGHVGHLDSTLGQGQLPSNFKNTQCRVMSLLIAPTSRHLCSLLSQFPPCVVCCCLLAPSCFVPLALAIRATTSSIYFLLAISNILPLHPTIYFTPSTPHLVLSGVLPRTPTPPTLPLPFNFTLHTSCHSYIASLWLVMPFRRKLKIACTLHDAYTSQCAEHTTEGVTTHPTQTNYNSGFDGGAERYTLYYTDRPNSKAHHLSKPTMA